MLFTNVPGRLQRHLSHSPNNTIDSSKSLVARYKKDIWMIFEFRRTSGFYWTTDSVRDDSKSHRNANVVVASYGAKKQRKRTETVTHKWDRKHFIEGGCTTIGFRKGMDFFLWGHINSLVYETPIPSVEHLIARIYVSLKKIHDMPAKSSSAEKIPCSAF
ncbi:hypothetical protein TNCV_4160291 [Trichonephila clavipes]|nr:hypothetical protein TNCV_4160291 [Trichonephila clavipes]